MEFFSKRQTRKTRSPEPLTYRSPRPYQARIEATSRKPGYTFHLPGLSDQDEAPRPFQKCARLQRRLGLRSARSRRSRSKRSRPPEQKMSIKSCEDERGLVWLVSAFRSCRIFQLENVFDDGLDVSQEPCPLAQWTLESENHLNLCLKISRIQTEFLLGYSHSAKFLKDSQNCSGLAYFGSFRLISTQKSKSPTTALP